MTSFLFRCRPGPVHDRVQVYGGPDAQHRALLGTLVMRHDESENLAWLLVHAGFWMEGVTGDLNWSGSIDVAKR